jgi:hypothetical protein
MKVSRTQTRLAAVLEALFRRWPSLVGFSVQEARTLEHELVLADVETSPWPAGSLEIVREIAAALHALVDDEPAMRELLHGRTFARTLH